MAWESERGKSLRYAPENLHSTKMAFEVKCAGALYVAQLVKCLPSMREVLGSIPSPT